MSNKYINSNNFLFKILFCIFPFLLISGPFLPDLMVTLLSLYFLAHCFCNKKFFFLRYRLILLFFAFYLYLNINSFFINFSSVSIATSIPYIRMILFAIFIAYLFKEIIDLKKIIFFSLLASYLILLLDSFIQIITGQNIFGYPIINSRVASFFGDKLIMGSYVSRTLPILLAISYFENFKHSNFLRILCITVAGILVIFSAERTALFLYIMTALVYLVLLNNVKKIIYNVGLLGCIFSTIFFFKPSSLDRLYTHTFNQFKEKKGFLFSERHEMHFLTAYNMFVDKKYFGHGIKSFRYLCDDARYTVEEVISNNNKKFAPIDSYFYFVEKSHLTTAAVYFVKPSEKDKFEEIIKSKKPIDELFLNKYSIMYFPVKQYIFDIIESGTKVSKGNFVISHNDFSNGCNTHPHSSHLQILSELGLFGYLFLFVFFVYLIIIFITNVINFFLKQKNIINSNNQLYSAFIILGIIQSLFPIIPSGNIFNNWISCLLYFKLGFLFHYLYLYKKL